MDTARAAPGARGVSDGARTRDTWDHNPVLYLLSYTHHGGRTGLFGRRSGISLASGQRRAQGAAEPAPSTIADGVPAAKPATTAWICAVAGPGGVTNSVPR